MHVSDPGGGSKLNFEGPTRPKEGDLITEESYLKSITFENNAYLMRNGPLL